MIVINTTVLTLVQSGLSDVGGKGLSDGVTQLTTLVDNHLDNEAEVCHLLLLLLFLFKNYLFISSISLV